MGTIKGIRTELNKYRPDQLRDHGRFAYEGGSKFELKDRPVKSTRIEDTRLGELIAKDTEFIDDEQLAAVDGIERHGGHAGSAELGRPQASPGC